MKGNGMIFHIRCRFFVSKLNYYQLKVLKVMVSDKIVDLERKGLILDTPNGKKIKAKKKVGKK